MLREELGVGNRLLIGLRPASRVFAYSTGNNQYQCAPHMTLCSDSFMYQAERYRHGECHYQVTTKKRCFFAYLPTYMAPRTSSPRSRCRKADTIHAKFDFSRLLINNRA